MTDEGRKIQVTVLTGFLGAGKTALLKHILESAEHGMKFAIIENEFGEVGVDEKVIKQDSEEQLIEVMNGCIRYTVRGALVKVLQKLRSKMNSFDGCIIETTGLANPAPVAQTFFVDDSISALYKLDGIITVVDAKHALQHLREKKPKGVENEAVEQIAFADRIILNKIDLVSASKLKQVTSAVRKINNHAQFVTAQHSKVDPKALINISAFSLKRVLEFDPEFMDTDGEHLHDTRVSSISFKFEGEVDVNKLQCWIREMIQSEAANMFRYKGVLAVEGINEKYLFQGVHKLFSGGFEAYKWTQHEKRECRFVFIGRNLKKKMLREKFMACRVESELRFSVGDHVVVNVGEWVSGKILRLWDAGYPYRIELADEGGTNIYCPEDNDDLVRSRKRKL